MKRILLQFIILISSLSFAQTYQSGLTLEYQGKDDKTPLANVNVIAGGATARSNESGMFKLQLKGYDVGDLLDVDISNVVILDGYILFNKDAVMQWTVSQKGTYFTIVLCKKDRFNTLVKQYYGVSEKSYKHQYEVEKAEIQKLKKEGKIKEELFRQQLDESEQRYSTAMKQLQENAELLARIDENELDSIDQVIIELTKSGRIDAAVELIGEKDTSSKLKQAAQKLAEARKQLSFYKEKTEEALSERQMVISSAKNDIRILSAAGGKKNFEKCNVLWESVIESEPDDYKLFLECSRFYLRQMKLEDAMKYADMANRIIDDKYSGLDRILAKSELVSIKEEILTRKNEFEGRIDILTSLMDEASTYIDDITNEYMNEALELGKMYQTGITDTEDDLKKYKNFLLKAQSPTIQSRLPIQNKASLQTSSGILSTSEKEYDKAIVHFNEAIKLMKQSNLDDEQIKRFQINQLSNIAECYELLGKQDSALFKHQEAQIIAQKLYLTNPEGNMDVLATTSMGIAFNLKINKKFNEALTVYSDVINIMSKLYEQAPRAFGLNYIACLRHQKDIYYMQNKIDSACSYMNTAVKIARELVSKDKHYSTALAETLNQSAQIHLLTDNAEARKELEEAASIYRELVDANSANYLNTYCDVLMSLLNVYMNMEDYSMMETTAKNSIDYLSAQSGEDHLARSVYFIKQLLAYSCFMQGKAEQASKIIKEDIPQLRKLAKRNPEMYNDVLAFFLELNIEVMQIPAEDRIEIYQEMISLFDYLYRTNPNELFAKNLSSTQGSLSYCLILNSKFAEAEETARKALELAPNQEWIFTNLASSLLLQGKTEQSLEVINGKMGGDDNGTPLKKILLTDLEEYISKGIVPSEYRHNVETVKELLSK